MPFTPADLARLAALARLRLSEEEARALPGQLEAILAHVEALRRADDGGAAPLPQAGAAPLREDRPGADPLLLPPEAVAPAWADGFFVVPRLRSLGPDHRGGAG